jgi:hypothetical protein
MTLKTVLKNGLGLLAVTLVAMPTLAVAKTKKAEKTIECQVTVEDGDVTVAKTINGKTVKTDEGDEDCAVVINDSMSWGAPNGFNLHRLDGADGEIKIIMESDDGPGRNFFRKSGGGKTRIFVQDGRRSGGLDGLHTWLGDDGFGPGMPFAMGQGLHLMFIDEDNKELDLDKDGTVTEAEARKARNAKLKSYDSNRDGMLSLDEYQAYWLSKRHAKMVDDFQDLDEDGDARITGEEFSSSAVKSARMQEKMQKMMAEHKAKSVSKHKKKRK